MKCEDLYGLAWVSEVALAHDGSRVCYVLERPVQATDTVERSGWFVDLEVRPTAPLRIECVGSLHSPVWAPDGARIACLCPARSGSPRMEDLLLVPRDGTDPVRLLADLMDAGPPRWAPDSQSVAIATMVDARSGSDASDGSPEIQVVETLNQKLDGYGVLASQSRVLARVDVATGVVLELVRGELWVEDYSWSPSGAEIVFSASLPLTRWPPVQPGAVRASSLYIVPSEGGVPRAITPRIGSAGTPEFSSDGQLVVYAGLRQLRPGNTELLVVPAAGDASPVQLARSLDRSVVVGAAGRPGTRPTFLAGRHDVLFSARDGGCVQLFLAPADGGSPRRLLGSSSSSIGPLGVCQRPPVLVYVRRSGTEFGVLRSLNLSTGSDVMVVSPGVPSSADDVVTPVPMQFRAQDGLVLHGWLLSNSVGDRTAGARAAPPSAREGGRQPLLVDLHGGSFSGAWSPVLDASRLYHQELVSRGWSILLLNQRGSDGYGTAFSHGAIGAWGAADGSDVLTAIDLLVARGLVDDSRVAVTGYSYGGFLSNWLTAHTTRFCASVAGGSICDFVSLYATSDMGWAMCEFDIGVPVSTDPVTALRRSPLVDAGRVRTPTLLLHGELDSRCPVGQAEEWFAALLQAQCEVRLVRYRGADHSFLASGRPSLRLDYGRRLIEWISRHADRSFES